MIDPDTRRLVLFGIEFAGVVLLASGIGVVFGDVGASAIVVGLWLMFIVLMASRRDR